MPLFSKVIVNIGGWLAWEVTRSLSLLGKFSANVQQTSLLQQTRAACHSSRPTSFHMLHMLGTFQLHFTKLKLSLESRERVARVA